MPSRKPAEQQTHEPYLISLLCRVIRQFTSDLGVEMNEQVQFDFSKTSVRMFSFSTWIRARDH